MYLEAVRRDLGAIDEAHRLRNVEPRAVDLLVDFSSNDYLGLATDKMVVQAFRNAQRAGSGGARLLGGRHREHSLLEEELAQWLGRERALLFTSGYHAALGAITVFSRYVDGLYSDALNHASLIDGMRMSKTPRHIYPHGRFPAQRSGSAMIVTETTFSMDGDVINAAEIVASLGPSDIALFDEAHALGVTGPQGAGLARGIDDSRVLIMGTLSKSFGVLGGFVAGPAEAIDLLINTARTFIFDTALPPAIALAARVALVRIKNDEERRMSLRANVARLREGLRAFGFDAPDSPSPIVPIVVGSEERALALSDALLQRKLYVPAIRPPTVPAETCRLRVSMRADHTLEHVDLLLGELKRCIAIS